MAIEGLVDDKSRLLVRDAGVSFIGAVGSLSDTGFARPAVDLAP
jgi:hypothetical protein